MDHSFRCIVLVLVAAALTLGTGLVFAQANPLPIPMSIAPLTPTASGLNSMVTFDARNVGTAANAGYYTRPVLVSNNTLAGLGKGLLRRAVPVAAMLAAIEGAGWAINELTGQVLSGPAQPTVAPAGTSYVQGQQHSHPTFAAAGAFEASYMAANGFGQYAPAYDGVTNCSAPGIGGGYSCQLKIKLNNGGQSLVWATYVPNNNPGTNRPLYALQPAPVTNAQLGQLVANNPALASAALRNPDGSVNRNPDVMAAAQALAAQLAATDPAQQPDPVAEWETGQQGGPSPAGAGELPGFCAWATIVCTLADYVMDDADEAEEPTVPYVDIPVAEGWSSGLGSGSCPAPFSVEINIGGTSAPVEFSYQPLCDLAGYINPLVHAAAAFMCLFIIAGVRRAS